MKKIHLILIVCVISIILLAGCSKIKSPLEEFDESSQLWVNRDYESMYGNLSIVAKENISEENFKKAYEEFYESVGLETLSIKNLADVEALKEIIKKEEKISIPIEVSLRTVNGDKKYNTDVIMVKEKIEDKYVWNLEWDYDLIYKSMAEGDQVKTSYERPIRGEILDKNGIKLAENGEIIQVGIVLERLGDMKEEIISDISKTFSVSEEDIKDRLSLSWVKENTFVDLFEISADEFPQIEQLHEKNSGATYKKLSGRVYPYKEITAHLTGYIGYINDEELKQLKVMGFSKNDKLGRDGLEKIFDGSLRGVPGKKIAIVDKNGEDKEILFEEVVKNGEDLKLAIDIDTQIKLYNQLDGEQGTATVMNYETGEVVALVSAPSYNPNRFILGMSNEEFNKLQQDEAKPLLERFAQVYVPGSSLKPITTAIALNESKIDDGFIMDNVEGYKWQKDSSWGGKFITRVTDPGTAVDLEKAMVNSDNIYFAQVALAIGEDTFINKAKEFGIGEVLKLRYGIKKSQLASNDKISSEELLADTGYGQGEVLISVLNLSKAYSAFVNKGSVIEPKLIMDNNEPEFTNVISEEVANKIFDLMIKAVKNGTGRDAYVEGKTIAGKTGTAEINVGKGSSQKKELGWFGAIDNSKETPYITVMMIENVEDKGGSHYVVPKVRSLIEGY